MSSKRSFSSISHSCITLIAAVGLLLATNSASARVLVQVGKITIAADQVIDVVPDVVIHLKNNIEVGNAVGDHFVAGLGANSTVSVDLSSETVTVLALDGQTQLLCFDVQYPIATTANDLQIVPSLGEVRWTGTAVMTMPSIAPAAMSTVTFTGSFVVNVDDGYFNGTASLHDDFWGQDLVNAHVEFDTRAPWWGICIDIELGDDEPLELTDAIKIGRGHKNVVICPAQGRYEFQFESPSLSVDLPGTEGISLSFEPLPSLLLSVDFHARRAEMTGKLEISGETLGLGVPIGVGLEGTRLLTWDPWTYIDETGLEAIALHTLHLRLFNSRHEFDFTNLRFDFKDELLKLHIGNLYGMNLFSSQTHIEILDEEGEFSPRFRGRGVCSQFAGSVHPLGGTGVELTAEYNYIADSLTGKILGEFSIYNFLIASSGCSYSVVGEEVFSTGAIELLGEWVQVEYEIGSAFVAGRTQSGFWLWPFWIPVESHFLLSADGLTLTAHFSEFITIAFWIHADGHWEIIWHTPEPQVIYEGIKWLIERQLANGSWSNDPALTSFAVVCMLNAGYGENNSHVANGLEYIRDRINPNGSVHNQSNRYTYYTSIAILPLVATHNPDYHGEIAIMRDWLIESQWDEASYYGSVGPEHSYYGGFGYGNHTRPDLSNTQWALMGLKAADREIGLVAGDTFDKAKVFLGRCQNADGGSGYTPGDASIHTMTAASVWSYSLCGVSASDPRVADGIQWLADRYSLTNPDGWGYWSEYYYKLTLAKALVMSHKTTLAGKNWFAELAACLIDERLSGGQWPDTGMMGSHADVHVYDPQGRHVGVNYATMTVDSAIPGAAFRLLGEDGEELPFVYPIPESARQMVYLPQLVSGSYRIEIIGTSNGPFELTVEGSQDDQVVTTHVFVGEVTIGQHLGTHVTVSAMEGALTLIYEALSCLPVLDVEPGTLTVYGSPNTVAEATFTVREAGGHETLHSVGIYATDLVGPENTIPGTAVTFGENYFDVAPGAAEVVTAAITMPPDFAGPYVGAIVVESLDGGTRQISLTIAGLPDGVVVVNVEATGSQNGSSWIDAFKDLQDALAYVSVNHSLTEIWVAAGAYAPAEADGSRDQTFQLLNGVGVYGGFAGWESNRDQRDIQANVTILTGDLNGDDGPDFTNNGENAHHVVTGSGCDGTAILDGFTLTGGNANRNYPRNCGGGMFNVSGSPTVANCRFEANVAYDGAGMHNRDFSSPSVTACAFVNNLAGQGGAISNLNRSSPAVTNCLFENNLARCWDGGALYCVNYSRPTVLHSRFRGNAANYDGGSVCNLHWSSPRFYNCEFTNELAGGAGGVMYCFNGSQAKMIGCTLSNNTAANGAALAFDSFAKGEAVVEARTGEFWRDNLGKTVHAGRGLVLDCGSKEESTPRGTEAAQGPSNVYVANSIVWDGADGIWNADGSTVTIVYSDVYGGWPGEGNLDADPLFMDAGSGDFHLTLGSPCVDAGSDPLVPAGITTDLDGSPRIVDGNLDGILTVDMGAYELQGSGLLAGDFDGDGDVDLDDFGVFEGCFSGRLAVVSGDCARCDVNQDTFIDLQDFAWFQRAFRP